MSESSLYAVVAVALPVLNPYHYGIPAALRGVLEVGHGVLIPFGARKVSGFVIKLTDEITFDESKVRSIEQLLDPQPLFESDMLPFLSWTADYYHHPLGEVIRASLPSGLLMKSRLCCRLTDSGREQLNSSGLDSRQEQILRLLALRGPVAWTRLQRDFAIPEAARLLRQFHKAGWVRIEQHLDSSRVAQKYRKVYRLADSVTPRDLKGSVQRLVLECLIELGEADVSELAEALESRGQRVSSLSAPLKRLRELGIVSVESRESWRDTQWGFEVVDESHRLTPEQEIALERLRAKAGEGTFGSFVLHGVTGSGKTEVYMQLVAETLARGRGAIVLVPEIALTPQAAGRFRARFGEKIACMHSGLSRGERFDAWRRLQTGEAQVVIGARSAVFAPIKNLGLVIVDEEHDLSFKQDSGLRYSARDLAVVRAKMEGSIVLLGSATPSLESCANVQRGRFEGLELKKRVHQRPLPVIRIIDLCARESRPAEADGMFSPQLEEAFRGTITDGRQVILLLNRRGFAPFVLCSSCGGSFRCIHCDISLTYHRRRNLLLCHYCGLGRVLPQKCPHCGDDALQLMGQGTERLEDWLQEQYPGLSVGRLDRDTIASKEACSKLLDAFRKESIQVLVGTQMVVKGHDFPSVTLVGILQADYALNLPDFRASERTFQLVTQVAGRAGRGIEKGKVFVQTFSPHHPSIAMAAAYDHKGFVERELRIRRAHRYPPYVRMALVQVSARDEGRAERRARNLASSLGGATAGQLDRIEILGPAPAPLTRLQGWFRWQIVLKAGSVKPIQAILKEFESEFFSGGIELRVSVDVDPQHLL